jgi:hypothetical protein
MSAPGVCQSLGQVNGQLHHAASVQKHLKPLQELSSIQTGLANIALQASTQQIENNLKGAKRLGIQAGTQQQTTPDTFHQGNPTYYSSDEGNSAENSVHPNDQSNNTQTKSPSSAQQKRLPNDPPRDILIHLAS